VTAETIKPETEIEVIQEKNKQNFRQLLSLTPKIFWQPEQADREITRIKRHSKFHIYRIIELERGVHE